MANVKINQLPSGSYNAKVYDYTTADGKRKYKSITASSKSEVKRLIAVFLAEREELHTEREKREDPAYMTVGEAIDKYIESKSNVLSPSTIRGYRQARNHSFPELMERGIDEVTSAELQAAVNAEAVHSSPKTVRNKYGLLVSALAVYAPDLKIKVTLPQKVKPDIAIPTENEVKQMFEAVAGTELEIPLYLGALCGMRRSEIAALRWDDVNFENGTITIRAAKVLNEEGEYVLKGTKTIAGKRIIRMFTRVADKLTTAKEAAVGETVTTLLPAHITDRFAVMLTKAGLPHYRFHDLRHYTVSVMLSLNMPKNYIADYVGHETERMIDLVYGHIMATAKSTFEDRVNDYYDKIFGNAT